MKQSNIIPIILFTFLSLIIIFPLLSPGFILTLDLPATDNLKLPKVSDNSFFFGSFLYLLHLAIPNYLLQKLILFLSLSLAGLGMYRLVSLENTVSRIFAGLFYMINPFVYERLVSGQWLLMAGYALLPWLVSAIVDFFKNSTAKKAVLLSLFLTLLANISLHFLFFTLLFFIVYGGAVYVIYPKNFHPQVRTIGGFVILLLIFNLNWLAGIVIEFFNPSTFLFYLDRNELVSFQSVADGNFGLIFNLLAGYGFWAEANNYFISPKNLFPLWPVTTVAILTLFVYGFYLSLKRKNNLAMVLTLGIIFLLALDFSLGVASKQFAPIVLFLYQKLVFLKAFREPQKFVALIMFSYAYFSSFSLGDILKRLMGLKKTILSLLLLLLPVVYTLPIFWGFWGQLKPVFYPQSWYETNKILASDNDRFLTLFFPWHQYMRFAFNNDRVVANPAAYFFDKPILSSLNYETAYLNLSDKRPEGLHIEGLLRMEKKGVNLLGQKIDQPVSWAEALSAVSIKYIILAKEADFQEYMFLDNSLDFTKIYDSNELIVYQNTKWIAQEGNN